MVRTRRSCPEPTKQCPICNEQVPASFLIAHASSCTGVAKNTPEESTRFSSKTKDTLQSDHNNNCIYNDKINSAFQEKLSFTKSNNTKILEKSTPIFEFKSYGVSFDSEDENDDFDFSVSYIDDQVLKTMLEMKNIARQQYYRQYMINIGLIKPTMTDLKEKNKLVQTTTSPKQPVSKTVVFK